jgi:hypothetical protein
MRTTLRFVAVTLDADMDAPEAWELSTWVHTRSTSPTGNL